MRIGIALVGQTALCTALACGGPKAPTTPSPSEAEAASNPAPFAQSPDPPPEKTATESAAGDSPAAENPPEGTKNTKGEADLRGRDITYRPTQSGLVIELEGLKLEPKADLVKQGGGFGIKLVLRATSTDSHMHRLLKSDRGPLMVAAEIDRGGGKKERVADERKGDAEDFVAPGDSADFVQKVPHVVFWGQTLTLHVGLWGLGRDADDRKPVRKLFIVKAVPGTKMPDVIVSPPE